MYNLTDIWIHVVEPRYNSYVTKDMDPASITNHILRPSQNRKTKLTMEQQDPPIEEKI